MKKIRPLKPSQSTRGMAAKFYTEQLPYGEDMLIKTVKATPTNERRVVAIKHTKTDDKPHWHFMDDATDGTNFNVGGELHRNGIYFRKDVDDTLMANRGLETLGEFSAYLSYVLHQDSESQKAGKNAYSIDDIVSNLPRTELQNILDGRPSKKKKLSAAEQIEIARSAGYEGKGFYTVANTVGIAGMSSSTEDKLRKVYEKGAKQRMNEHLRLDRLCIEIQTKMGDEGTEDRVVVAAVERALSGMEIAIDNYGGICRIMPTTNAFITFQHIDSMAGEYAKEIDTGFLGANTKSLWTGQYYIFINRVSALKQDYKNNKCFICKIENHKLICTSSAVITGENRRKTIGTMYKDFRDKFELALTKTDGDDLARINLDELNA